MEPDFNPYQSPAAGFADSLELNGTEEEFRPTYKLYSIGAIVLASFLGSLFAGGIVMAVNYKRLGRFGAALHSVVWAFVFTAAIITICGEIVAGASS